MAGNVLFFLFVTLTLAQYNDDSDYDYESFENIPRPVKNHVSETGASGPDDFYIISEMENDQGTWNSGIEATPQIFENERTEKKLALPRKRVSDWYKESPKIYRYTKHRIPGYDYDELEFTNGNGFQRCDAKSLWSHCVCQFTCQEPSVVDCFTPCKSGCECKEDFVFDELTQTCIPPEQCSNLKDYFI